MTAPEQMMAELRQVVRRYAAEHDLHHPHLVALAQMTFAMDLAGMGYDEATITAVAQVGACPERKAAGVGDWLAEAEEVMEAAEAVAA